MNEPNNIILRLEELQVGGKFKEALNLLDEQLKTSLDTNHRELFLYHKAKVFLSLSEDQKAKETTEELLNSLTKHDNPDLWFQTVILQAEVIRFLGEVDKSLALLENLLKELPITIEIPQDNQKKLHALILRQLGIIMWMKSDFSKALDIFSQGLVLAEEINDEFTEAKLYNNLGIVYDDMGELEKALKYYHESLFIEEKLHGVKTGMAGVLNNIAVVYLRQGELTTSLNYFERSLDIYQETANKQLLGMSLGNIALIHYIKGDLDLSLEFQEKNLHLQQQLQQKIELSKAYHNIALVYQAKSDYNKAYEYYKQSLTLKREGSSNDVGIAATLVSLVKLMLEMNNNSQGEVYFHELEEITTHQNSKVIEQQCRFCKAILEKSKPRMIAKAEAQRLLQVIITEECVNYDLIVDSMLLLCDLLLYELRTHECHEAFMEFKSLLNKLIEVAKNQNSYSSLAETYFLQSKLHLLEMDFQGAQELLNKAHSLAEKKNFVRLAIALASEKEFVVQQIEQLKNVAVTNETLIQRVKLARLEESILRIYNKKLADISNLPQFAVEYIRLCLFKDANEGPEAVDSEPIPFTDDQRSLLAKIAVYYSIALGQGEGKNLGLYGPLPLPNTPDHEALTYSFFLADPLNTDHRSKGKSFCFIVIIFPRSLEHFLTDRKQIIMTIENALNQVFESKARNVNALDQNFLRSIKYKLLGLEQK